MRMLRDLVGDTLSNRYRIVSRLAGGGMGEVFRGHDLLLDRAVAVKVLQPSLAADPELVARFKQEARAAARLNHPHIVGVHDWGAADDQTYYMVMEYVAGTDLREVLTSRGALDQAHAVEIVAAVCDALAVAHGVNLVHRDIKPENILIARDGTVKVTDFGIAIMSDVELTLPGGTIPGTIRYLSPEQARGGTASPATDVWGAGALLFELLTGESLFEGGGIETLQRRAVELPRLPSELVAELPPELDPIVECSCAPDPTNRYLHASDMAQALRAVPVATKEDLTIVLDAVADDDVAPDMMPTTFVRGRHLRRGARWKWPAVALLAIALLGVLVVKGVAALTAPEIVDVPHLAGSKLAKARVQVAEAGLELEVEDRVRSISVPAGEIVEQTPADGTLEEGQTIAVVVSRGPPLSDVPELAGIALREARIRLNAAELEVDVLGVEYSLEPKGTIVSQEPAKGRLEWGESVGVVISRGPRPVEVPDVSGMDLAQAEKTLRKAGFETAVVQAYSNRVREGGVIGTDPPSGVTSSEGSVIEIEVSMGPRFEDVRLPDVRGLTLAEATAKLEALGLRVEVEKSCPGGSTVVETHPIPGTMVRQNTAIALFVC